MSNKSKQKKNRRQTRQGRFEPKVTPTHFIRIERIRVEIDATRKWYIVRTAPGRERKVKLDLERAGFTTFMAVNSAMEIRRGKAVEVQRRPAAGYLFVGIDPAECGRELLWQYHDDVIGAATAVTFTSNTGATATYESRTAKERPFYRVFGPFGVSSLQRFVDRLDPTPVAVLWHGETPLLTFPAQASGLVEGEMLGVAQVLETQQAA